GPVDAHRRVGGPTMVVTARREQTVVGVAGAWIGPDGGQSAVLVARAHRHQGIGRHLSAALTAAVADAGWECWELRPLSPED
ncbi:MAG: GNAT family N-acetyltransferase, partial [Actinomycetota bacterium]|nr:GNAT family N-acetyltransferase [Actinomycetota bacterium]